MRLVLNKSKLSKYGSLCICCGLLFFAFGCQELNTTVDTVLGLNASPAQATGNATFPQPFMLAANKPPSGGAATPGTRKQVPQGKKRPPAVRAPMPGAGKKLLKGEKLKVEFERDPFHPPAERILPSECPPSMPLCRFDRSQLKLVGIIRVSSGQFKGMVDDPDGRGYFVIPGTQIGGATVTQVSAKGMTLHDHLSKENVQMPLVKEEKEASEF
jgi:hypothetical protein